MKHLLLCPLARCKRSARPITMDRRGGRPITHNACAKETRRQSPPSTTTRFICYTYATQAAPGNWSIKRPNNSAWGPEESVTTATVANAALSVDRASGHAYKPYGEQPGITGTDIPVGRRAGESWSNQPVTFGLHQNMDPAISVMGRACCLGPAGFKRRLLLHCLCHQTETVSGRIDP